MTKKADKQKEQTGELKQELQVMEDKWKRALADYQNLEKRISVQQQMYVKMASVGVVKKLLPVLDDLQRAMKHINDEGLIMIERQLLGVLRDEGVETIEAMDKPFDPLTMECVEITQGKNDVVVKVVEDGYRMGETVIRPAKVLVGGGVVKKTDDRSIK
jgi:molecular chaperone GrpE